MEEVVELGAKHKYQCDLPDDLGEGRAFLGLHVRILGFGVWQPKSS